ncbi:MAG: hypothetical protein ACD_23C01050G0002, partial [uncultured bacterium]
VSTNFTTTAVLANRLNALCCYTFYSTDQHRVYPEFPPHSLRRKHFHLQLFDWDLCCARGGLQRGHSSRHRCGERRILKHTA